MADAATAQLTTARADPADPAAPATPAEEESGGELPVFVSYASADRRRALGVVRALERAGIRAWIDVASIPGGHSYGPQIVDGIRASTALLLLCSAASLASRNVRQEIQLAWRFGRPILPLRLEPVAFPESLAYWLEGAQWIDVLDRPPTRWLRPVLGALSRLVAAPGAAPGRIDGPSSGLPAASRLPVPLTPLLGREAELADLRRRLEGGSRLLTLTGPGGVGKTRLALELAHLELAHAVAGADQGDGDGVGERGFEGAVFVDLAPVTEPERVLPAIAAALGVREAGEQGLAAQLQAVLAPRRLLLLVDNVEQVVAAAPDLAGLLAAAPAVVLLVTSRAPLQVRGEQVVPIAPLALPPRAQPAGAEVTGHGGHLGVATEGLATEGLAMVAASPAVALFLDRAQAAGTAVVLSAANVRTIAEIVRRLDGLPLAIELAAARTRLFPPAALLKRLERRLPVLTGGAADLPARQQALRDTIAWSHDLLGPDEQVLLRRLAVFAGGASFEAIEAVAGDAEEMGDAGELDLYEGLAGLVRQSLLRQGRSEGEPRFTMLETIREFARERLEASGEAAAVRARHAAFFLALAEAAEPTGNRVPDLDTLNQLKTEHDNLRAALNWGLDADPILALRLGGSLAWFWELRGYLSEGREWLGRALAEGSSAPPAVRAKALWGAGDLAEVQLDLDVATAHLTEALNLWRDLGDRAGMARAHHRLGHAAVDQRDLDLAAQHYTESIALWREVGNEREEAGAMSGLGNIAYYRGEQQRAVEIWTEAAAHFRTLGDKRRLALLLGNIGAVELSYGDLGKAARLHEEALVLLRELGEQSHLARTLNNLGMALELLGDWDRAQTLMEESLQRYRELGIEQATAEPLYGLAWLAWDRRDFPRAAAFMREAIAVLHPDHAPVVVANCAELVAALAAHQGEHQRGARLLGGATALREANGIELPPNDREFHERATREVQTGLSPETMAEQFAAGQALSAKETAAEAAALAAELAAAGSAQSELAAERSVLAR